MKVCGMMSKASRFFDDALSNCKRAMFLMKERKEKTKMLLELHSGNKK